MVSMQLSSALALAVIPLLSLTGQAVPVWLAVVTSLAVASCFVWFDAAAFGALPRLAGRDRVVEANSLVWTGTTLVGIGAPALGGLLVAALGPAVALGVDAAAYVLAAALLLAVAGTMDPDRGQAEAPEPLGSRWRRDMSEGLTFIRRQPLVRDLTLMGFGNSVVAGGVTAVLVVLVADRTRGAAEGQFGLLLTVMAVGAFVAAALLPRLARCVPVGRLTLVSLTAGVPLVLGVAVSTSLTLLMAMLLGWSLCTTLVVLNGITARQLVTPDHLQARVNTSARMLAWGGSPFGAVLAGAITQQLGVAAALATAAAVLAATAAAGWLTPLRSMRLAAPMPQ
jgi:MFS family permease